MRPDSESIVKVCGLRTVEAARTAMLAGADALGFILVESRRRIEPAEVRAIRDVLVADGDPVPVIVGVTVNATPAQLQAWSEEASLDYVQLSGNEAPDVLDDLAVPVVKTVHVSAGMSQDAISRIVEPWFDHSRPAIAIHIDTRVEGAYGGTGVQSDWTVARHVAEHYPAILAGGLKPGNVIDGIRTVRPRGVDVSSGVEIAGAKDSALIEAFVARAREGFRSIEQDQVFD